LNDSDSHHLRVLSPRLARAGPPLNPKLVRAAAGRAAGGQRARAIMIIGAPAQRAALRPPGPCAHPTWAGCAACGGGSTHRTGPRGEPRARVGCAAPWQRVGPGSVRVRQVPVDDSRRFPTLPNAKPSLPRARPMRNRDMDKRQHRHCFLSAHFAKLSWGPRCAAGARWPGVRDRVRALREFIESLLPGLGWPAHADAEGWQPRAPVHSGWIPELAASAWPPCRPQKSSVETFFRSATSIC
jgi:hypothetical protein